MDDLDFNLKIVLVSFKQCLNEKEEVLLDHYLAGWRGLVRCVPGATALPFPGPWSLVCCLHLSSARRRFPALAGQLLLLAAPEAGAASPTPQAELLLPWHRFLNSLGTVFSFISKDVVAKLQIMEKLCSGAQREHYSSLQSMVAYEVGNQLVDLERRSRHPDSGCRTVLRLHRALHWLQLFLEGLRASPEDARTATLCTDSYNASLAAYHPWIVRRAVTVAFCVLPTRKAFLEAMNVGSPEQAVEMLGEALPFIERVYSISQNLYAEHALLDLP